jgi:GNAT superfamily N-acetyltransferase
MMAEITTQTYTIRYATHSDVSTILQLIKELAIYEKELDSVRMTEELLKNTLSFPSTSSSTTSPASNFTSGHAKTLLIAPADSPSDVAGMALFFNNYSTWQGPGIYLEDLYVRESHRKKGYGKALLAALAREVKVLNPQGRLEWSVLKW